MSIEELHEITTLADLYLVLPTFSVSLDIALFNNKDLSQHISKNPCLALQEAHRLRHVVLFRECLIHVLGPWSCPRYQSMNECDAHLYAIIDA